jgi:aminoglycoside N3'-acetyltransferase
MVGSLTARTDVSRTDVADQLRTLGVVEGGVLLAHTSFRATGPIEGGPLGLIEALRAALTPGGTLVMPSWTGDDAELFNPATSPASPDLGAVAEMLWRLPGVLRSAHPFAFAAVGPRGRGGHLRSATVAAPHPGEPRRWRA